MTLYRMESWTLTELIEKKLETFKMWFYRSILRGSWVDSVNNETELETMGKEKELMFTIKKRKLEYLVRIMRNYSSSEQGRHS